MWRGGWACTRAMNGQLIQQEHITGPEGRFDERAAPEQLGYRLLHHLGVRLKPANRRDDVVDPLRDETDTRAFMTAVVERGPDVERGADAVELSILVPADAGVFVADSANDDPLSNGYRRLLQIVADDADEARRLIRVLATPATIASTSAEAGMRTRSESGCKWARTRVTVSSSSMPRTTRLPW